MTTTELDAVADRINASREELSRLCKGGRWEMHIPVDRRRDSDIIFYATVRDAAKLLEVARAALNLRNTVVEFYAGEAGALAISKAIDRLET